MSKADRLKAMEVGEVIPGLTLFAGLSDEKVEVRARAKSKTGAVTLDLTYHGVKLGAAFGKVSDEGKIIWAEAD